MGEVTRTVTAMTATVARKSGTISINMRRVRMPAKRRANHCQMPSHRMLMATYTVSIVVMP